MVEVVSNAVCVPAVDCAADIMASGVSAGVVVGLSLVVIDLFLFVLSGMFQDTLDLFKIWWEKRKAQKDAEKKGGEG